MSEDASKPAQQINNQPKALVIMAHIVSILFHPVFMPLVMAMALYQFSPFSFSGIQPNVLKNWFLSIGITAVGFPIVSILLMKPLGFIESFRMPDAKDRIIPLITSMVFYFWVSHVFNSMDEVVVPLIIKVLLLGNFWGIVVLFIINIFTKISMHTAAAGGMVGILLILLITSPVNMLKPFFISLIIAGIIGTARSILGAHQRGDIWLGYIVGILVQVAAYLYMK